MEQEKKHCDEIARVAVPWGGKIINYCPVHGNQIVILGNAIGSPVTPRLLSAVSMVQCESLEELTELEKELNTKFLKSK